MPAVCRLGLATRGNSRLSREDVREAIERGINYLNWCGQPDGLSGAVSEPGNLRTEVVVAVQLQARDGDGMRKQVDRALAELNTDWLDVVTLYYVESEEEWEGMSGDGGALEALTDLKRQGVVRMVGLTSHQRRLAAGWAQTGKLDLLMLRYNAAHRGAETDVFPAISQPLPGEPLPGISITGKSTAGKPNTNEKVTGDPINEKEKAGGPVPFVAYTCLRWGALMEKTPADPPGFEPPPAREWYRYVLAEPRVAVALMAPRDRGELNHDLELLDHWRGPTAAERKALEAHGERMHAHAGEFW